MNDFSEEALKKIIDKFSIINYNKLTDYEKVISIDHHNLLMILSFSNDCPYHSTRKICSNIIEHFKTHHKDLKLPYVNRTSYYIPKTMTTINYEIMEDEQYNCLKEYFHCFQVIPNYIKVMNLHPKYLISFVSMEKCLFYDDGPLPLNLRYYIALMAASAHSCDVLVKFYETNFLKHGGNSKWISGIETSSPKIKLLTNFIKKSSHQPWTINYDCISGLLKSNVWSLSEFVQAIVIISHVICLSSFTHGVGIDYHIGSLAEKRSSTISTDSNTMLDMNDDLINNSKYNCINLVNKLNELDTHRDKNKIDTIEDNFREFESTINKDLDANECQIQSNTSFYSYSSKYVDDPHFTYVDFANRPDKLKSPALRHHDFSWEEHCFSIISSYYPEAATFLDDKFTCIKSLTYNMIGSVNNVDTTSFRMATWNYIHVIHGIFHEDYSYHEVNKLLQRDFKSFIKKVVCFPNKITYDDYSNLFLDFSHSEKVHLTLLAMESRLQAILLYQMKALMMFMK